jgi:hypothetical protein
VEADRFDALSRVLSVAGSRRGTLTAALSGALGLLGLAHPDDAAAATSGKCKPRCGECEKCKKGDCDKKDGKKVCTKGKCQAKTNGTPCSAGTCQDRRCTNSPPPPSRVSVLAYQCPGPVETLSSGGTGRFAQPFTAAQSGTLQQIQFEIQKAIGSTGDFLVELLDFDADGPTNTALASATISGASVPDGNTTLTATFSGPPLTAGTEYAAAFSRLGGSSATALGRAGNDCTGKALHQFPNGSGEFTAVGDGIDIITTVIVLA